MSSTRLSADELDAANPNVTPQNGSVEENDLQDASYLDTSAAERIEGVGSGIEIESITFEPPNSSWKFKRFPSSSNYVDVIPTALDVIPPTIVLQSASMIQVMWTESDIDPTADGWPLRAEGNLKPPSGGGGVGSIPDFHWAAIVSAESFKPQITFYDQLINNFASGVRLDTVTTTLIEVRIKAHDEASYSGPLAISATEVPGSPEGAVEAEVQGYFLQPSDSDSEYYLMEMKVLSGGAMDYGDNPFDAAPSTVEDFEIGYLWKFRVDSDGNVIHIDPPTVLAAP